jgi:hypothetical protein
VELLPRLRLLLHDRLVQRPEVLQRSTFSLAALCADAGVFSFLVLSTPSPSASMQAHSLAAGEGEGAVERMDTGAGARENSGRQLLLDLVTSRPSAPLHLLEHFLAHVAAAQGEDGGPWRAAAVLPRWPCAHVAPDALALPSPLSDLLPPSPLCAACTAGVAMAPMVLRALLTQLLDPFPADMVRVHLPATAAFLCAGRTSGVELDGAADADAAMDESSGPATATSEPSPAQLVTMLLQRLTEAQPDSATASQLRECVSLLRLLFASMGSAQALILLHRVLLPLQRQRAAAAAADSASENERAVQRFRAAIFKQLIGFVAVQIEQDEANEE